MAEYGSVQATLEQLRRSLSTLTEPATPTAPAQQILLGIAQAGRDGSRPDLAELAELAADLLQVLADLRDADLLDVEAPDDEQQALRQFLLEATDCLEDALQDAPQSVDCMRRLKQTAQERWGECLAVIASDRGGDVDDGWPDLADDIARLADARRDHEQRDHAQRDHEPEQVDSAQIGLILQSLSPRASNAVSQHVAPTTTAPGPRAADAAAGSEPPELFADTRQSRNAAVDHLAADSSSASGKSAADTTLAPTLSPEVLDDPEIREAFLDDAQCGLCSIEAALLAYESDNASAQPLKQVCRELHTLKGASASVGLEQLASFLHRVEDDLQEACDGNGPVDLQPIFQAVDAVRAQMASCGGAPPEVAAGTNTSTAGPAPSTAPAPVSERFVDSSSASQDSVRVKSAQLDRLMDMLAELVMLRNRRESRVEHLKTVHSELVRCVSRLRAYEENYSSASAIAASLQLSPGVVSPGPRLPATKQHVSSLTEIANDVLEIGGSLRELYEPIGEENMAISRFIRHFRQELIQLRRVPIGGLFRRLQRSIRDAARAENKKIHLQLLGEDVGLETTLQQQLYEPLLHIVRNAVSHGIESEPQRTASGKRPTGNVTLEAHGSSNMLVITVRDDGRGLDYDALRRRGLEMGLIASDRPCSRAELARLIFHPGFSTKTSTSEISGRGVGMDVVATVLERLHSWIEVDSVPGQGTSVRLLIPLRSVIEHVMVFRAGGQDFAIPTQSVKFAGDPNTWDTSDFPLARFWQLFPQLPRQSKRDPQLFVLAAACDDAEVGATDAASRATVGDTSQQQQVGLLVDEIVGPEEVVVRPLPHLLAQQHLFSGVTLSGTGDIMLLFDSQQLLQRVGQLLREDDHGFTLADETQATPTTGKQILVVDDSRSSRRTLVRSLHRYAARIDEAVDGIDALRKLREQSYDLIFTDLEMPQMGGMDLLREVRASQRHGQTPVVIVSSRGEEVFRQQARDLGVTDYLTKPVSEPLVSQAMERLQQLEGQAV